jgi:branched-chain amino acid transport system ATP-binding protein
MGEPKLLILDEPSLGLAPKLVEEMFVLIAAIARDGLAVLLVEQNVVQSLDLAARAYVMENGAIVMSGASADLARDPALRNAYLGV